MDDRVSDHAELLVGHCTDVTADDDVLIKAPTSAEPLVIALYERLGRIGARPSLVWRNPRASRAYLRAVDPGDLRTSERERAAMEATDVVVLIKGARNAAETRDVDGETAAAASEATRPVLEARLDARWVITQHPTAADAQRAEMPTRAWTEYVYDAVLRDWTAQRERQRRVADTLASGSEIRVVAGDETDLSASIDGMDAYNDDATENLPGGEVATVPVVDSVEGTVTFDYPVRVRGREIEGVHLEFAGGEVVDYAAERNETALRDLLETDEGARRVGELGIGMNDGVDGISHNVLFDEKMGGTVHLALGRAMAECVPDDRTANDSAVHVDMLLDVSQGARIEVDGEVIQRDGQFWFEG